MNRLFELMGKVNPNFINNQTSNTGVLNESVIINDEKFNFKTKLKKSSFYHYESFSSEYDVDISDVDINIAWKVSFWLNSGGIENFIIDIISVDGTFELLFLDKQTTETVQEIQKNITEFKWKFVTDDANLAKGSSLYPTDATFDFSNNTCEISF